MRVDIWDVAASKEPEPIDAGLPRDFPDLFTLGKTLGKGGFGLVRVCTEKSSGKDFACKSIAKRLDIPNLSAAKQAAHIDNVKREITILQRLRGTLSVVEMRGAWEDDRDIHIVMELCRGGELEHELGRRPYSEKLVAGYMRSVLLTIAQCHAHRILHRDIKPGNFMLLSEEMESPLKAIDFGLAVFFEPDKLPRTDLGLEGTPWFMAPEVLSSEVWPVSDVWAAGVMAYQLLSGTMPFDDRRSASAPSLSLIWKSILGEEPNFRRSVWAEVSEEGKDFVKQLLIKDHTKRPAAAKMLEHPWLQTSFYSTNVRPLSATVVQRLQRFSQTPILKRSILELIAAELLEMAPPQLDASGHGFGAYADAAGDGVGAELGAERSDSALLSSLDSARSGPLSLGRYRSASVHGGRAFARTPSSQALSLLSTAHEKASRRRKDTTTDGGGGGGGGGSNVAALASGGDAQAGGRASTQALAAAPASAVRTPPTPISDQDLTTNKEEGSAHDGEDYWRVMRAASELALMGSQHGRGAALSYLHTHPRSEEERDEQRKAARLALDTSKHSGGEYERILKRLESQRESQARLLPRKLSAMRGSRSVGSLVGLQGRSRGAEDAGAALKESAAATVREVRAEGGEAPMAIDTPWPTSAGAAAPTPAPAEQEGGGRRRGGSAALAAMRAAGGPDEQNDSSLSTQKSEHKHAASSRHVTFLPLPEEEARRKQPASPPAPGRPHESWPAPSPQRAPHAEPTKVTTPAELSRLMRKMRFRDGEALSSEALSSALRKLGYDIAPSEVDTLLAELAPEAEGAAIHANQFVASQLDWRDLQQDNRDLWLECARRAFQGLDADRDGRINADQLLTVLKSKLPAAEVDYAVERALVEAGYADAEEMDFEGFLKLLQPESEEGPEALHLYDARMPAGVVPNLDPTVHRGTANVKAAALDPIDERP